MRLDPRPSPRAQADLAARRYAEHPTARNRVAAEVKARLAGDRTIALPAPKPAPTGD